MNDAREVKVLLECREMSVIWHLSHARPSREAISCCNPVPISEKVILLWTSRETTTSCHCNCGVLQSLLCPKILRDPRTTEEKERDHNTPPTQITTPSFAFTLIALISSQDKKLSFFHCLSGKRNLLKWYITKCLVHYLCGIQTTCGRESPWVSLTKVTNFSWNMQERHSEELNRGRKNGD